jgi:hypothetical protein
MHVTDIATGAPVWVYVLLVALIVLGVRRLKTRELPIAVALIPSAAFLIWSIVGAHAFALRAGMALSAGTWLTGAVIGAASAALLPEPRGDLVGHRRVRQPGSVVPLVLYVGVFVVRFACGAWAAINASQATAATAIGIVAGAAVMARLLVGVARWKPARSVAV